MRKILFVDDQQEPLFYHKELLEMEGYDVLWFRSAADTIEHVEHLAAKDLPDLVILDLNMPPDGRYAGNPANADGMRTGILLFQDICTALSGQCLSLPPFVVLTQLQNPNILGEVSRSLLGTPVLDKFRTAPVALLKAVHEILQKADKRNENA